MKNRKLALFFGVALILGLIWGCATPQGITDKFAYATYQTMNSSMATYKIIKNTIESLRAQHMVSDEGWAKFEQLGNKFIDEYQQAAIIMAKYKRGEVGQDAAEIAANVINKVLQELIEYYQAQVPEDQRKPLF